MAHPFDEDRVHCPNCKSSLVQTNDSWRCKSCGRQGKWNECPRCKTPMFAYQSVRHCDDCGYQLRETQHGWFEELPYKVHRNINHDHVEYEPGRTINLSRSEAARMDQGQIEEIPWLSPTGAKATSTGAESRQKEPGTPNPTYPGRAAWLKNQLTKRDWSALDVEGFGGPNHKTVQKLLKGYAVRDDVLEKLANALNKKGPKVELTEIPQD